MVTHEISGGRWSVAGGRWLLLVSSFLVFPAAGFAATLFCQVTAVSPAARSLKVNCSVTDFAATGKIEMRFVDRFAGIERLSERVYRMQIKDAAGQRLLPELLGNGVYRINPAGASQLSLEYEMRLGEVNGVTRDPSKYALTSSLGPDFGFLLLSDLLPGLCASDQEDCPSSAVRMKFQLPDGWQVATTEHENFGAFDVAAMDRAVFFIGKLRTQTINLEAATLHVALAGDASLSDVQVTLLVEAIARQQAKMMGGKLENQWPSDYLVTLAPFPVPLTGMRSSALTRGRTVVMMLNPDADARRTLTLYQKHLAHELFHFYLPEAFQVRENFDWFWEGMARYVALLTLNQLRFISLREYLDEISLEYESYAANPARKQLSLIAASQEKFANAASHELVYRKGTLVAALYDLELRAQSNGVKNVMDVLRDLYTNHWQRELGNREVLAAMRKAGKFDPFIRDYIEGTETIDLSRIVKPYGLQVETTSGSPRLNVVKNTSLKQNTLLAQLGH